MKAGITVPQIIFKYRVRDASIGGDNPFRWQDVTSDEIFSNKKVVVFSLPGAFTPTCSTFHLPGFEAAYAELKQLGVDEVYVLSVNDTFVMRKWMLDQDIKNIKFIPDGNGDFTRQMGMLVDKHNLGFGQRSWRYAMVVNNSVVEHWLEEPGREDNNGAGSFSVSSAESVLATLKSQG
tara:strand:- start:411 stop:944 length:534 start_codon:yes stop_codon:yes gene_type:complete